MQIPKPTEQDKDFLRSIVPDDPHVELKPMFGNLGAFVNGNMFAGLYGSTVGVRLIDDASREELAAIQGTGPYGPAERPMGGYLALPQSWSTQPKLAASWVRAAMTPDRRPAAEGAKACQTEGQVNQVSTVTFDRFVGITVFRAEDCIATIGDESGQSRCERIPAG